jgi:hypothetical protein
MPSIVRDVLVHASDTSKAFETMAAGRTVVKTVREAGAGGAWG